MQPGTRIGPYEITAKLGEGGMGEVYRARDTRLNRDVAIKVLPEEFTSHLERLRRFEQEARAVAALDHPNILAIHDVGTHEGAPYIVTELLEGESLRERLSGGTMPVRKAVEFSVQIAQGLAAAHEKGIVHRDLKPANMFITKDGHVKILDFGIAKLVAPRSLVEPAQATTVVEATAGGTTLGTIGYMSPEQVRGQSVDHRSDIFSFGCVLYEMLSGRPPFRKDNAPETMTAILHDEPPPLPSNVPRGLDRTVRRCLEKSPDDRFQSARDLGFGLQAEGEALTAPSLLRSARLPRRWLWAGVAALVVVAGAAVALYVSTVRGHAGAPTASGLIRSIAVLPLANLSGDPGQEYFSDGMTEELIATLSKISALKVISRTSVMQFKGSKKPLREIAAALGVEGVIEGSVLRAGERVRITAQLINASTDTHLWAESYDRDLKDVLALQSDVARAVAGEVRAKLTPQEQTPLASSRPVNPEAYELYLKGRYSWVKRTPESVTKAIRLFEQAIDADPTYAQAYGGLAECYMSLGFSFDVGSLPPTEAIPKAKAAVAKALEVAGSLADVHNPLAFMKLNYDWDFPGAETEFKRALELNPGNANVHHWYAHYLIVAGRPNDSLAESNRALELDPLSPIMSVHLGWLYYYLHDYERALNQLNKTLELDPNYGLAYWYIGLVNEQQGAFTQALAALKRGDELLKDNLVVKADLAHALAVSGRKADAEEALRNLLAISRTRYVSPFEIGLIYIGLGQSKEAFQWLNRAYKERSDLVVYLRVDPRLDPVRSDPRFQEMVRRMNFPETGKE